MTEEHGEYAVPLVIAPGSVEARLVERYRQARLEWLRHGRRMVIIVNDAGAVELFRADMHGRINDS